MTGTPMNPKELEAAYDQSKWASNMQVMLARFGVLSDAARAVVGEPARMRYGAAEEETLDLYRADRASAPVIVFVHGGAWRSGSAREHGFLAEMLLAAGMHFAALDFSSVVDAKGDLGVLVEQVRRAVVWLCQHGTSFGAHASRLYLVGHSSGAHLAAMALSTSWADYGLRADAIRGGLLISGTYDLGPLRHTSRREYIRIDDIAERHLSPLHHVSRLRAPLLLAAGSQESPEFVRQTKEYAEVAAKSGQSVTLVSGDTYNHFEMLETLGNPCGLMGRHLLKFVSDTGREH